MTNKTFAFTKGLRSFQSRNELHDLWRNALLSVPTAPETVAQCSMRVSMHEWYHITFNILMIILEYSSIKCDWYVNTVINHIHMPRTGSGNPTDVECVDCETDWKEYPLFEYNDICAIKSIIRVMRISKFIWARRFVSARMFLSDTKLWTIVRERSVIAGVSAVPCNTTWLYSNVS